MKADLKQLNRALAAPAGTRCFLFYGPDDAGSHALARRVAAGVGAEAERIDLSGSDLRSDPARLSDEAASLSMFGGARHILVSPAGDECADAVAALLEAPAAGNPVALIAGALKPSSKLLKLVLAAKEALAYCSYLPDARDWDRLVTEAARGHGLSVRPDLARRIAEGAAGNRAIIDQELGKFALYLDVTPDAAAVDLDHDVIEAVGAARDEGEAQTLVDCLFDGDGRGADVELARLRGQGTEGITLIRAALRRALLLAKLRARVDQGSSSASNVVDADKSLFWKEKPMLSRQLSGWRSPTLARCIERLAAAERALKSSGSLGPVAADEELLAIARQANRRG